MTNFYRTKSIDRAAYLVYLGAEIIEIYGRWGQATFELEVSKEVFEKESAKTLVDYRLYMKTRQKIKEMHRTKQGFQPKYLGKGGGFSFVEVSKLK